MSKHVSNCKTEVQTKLKQKCTMVKIIINRLMCTNRLRSKKDTHPENAIDVEKVQQKEVRYWIRSLE